MKNKYVIIILLIVFLSITGCGKKEPEKKEWKTDTYTKQSLMSNEIIEIFNRATSKADKQYKAIALLATQVVAGSNYMFLTLEDNTNYKILVINNDLDNKSTILYNNDFPYTKYTFENTEYKFEEVVGGWNVFTSPFLSSTKNNVLEDSIQKGFEEATKHLEGTTYLPIVTLGHLDEDGVKYAILCYGVIENANKDEGIFVVTYYNQSDNTKEIISSAQVNLNEYSE